MPGYSLNFLLVSGALTILRTAGCTATSGAEQSFEQQEKFCNFEEGTRTYNATDLLRCMNKLAADILSQDIPTPGVTSDRAYQDTGQSYPAYPFAPDYSIPPNDAGPSSHYEDQPTNSPIVSLLSGKLPVPNLVNLFNFGSLNRPGLNLYNALSSIARYDDLKCVPRILCEMASGSTPGGSLASIYRQSSVFQNFGNTALLGILSTFNPGGASPLLTFGKAALLGFTNRGQSHACYEEYSRCPRQADRLIFYLNNHKGGFFRLFNGIQNNYYQYLPASSYSNYENSGPEYKVLHSNAEQKSFLTFLKPESDRTGLDKFSKSDIYAGSDDDDSHFISTKSKQSESSKVVFPEKKRENSFHSKRIIELLNLNDNLNANNVYQPSQYQLHKYFPQSDENEYTRLTDFTQRNYDKEAEVE